MEVARIRAHLLGAERLLASADVSTLSPSARAARSRHREELRRYRERGVFPKNVDFADRRAPYFVDAEGTRCAMAHLIACSGDVELVARVARARNHAYIRDLANDPELVAWLDRNGLSLEEAARIQPMYGHSRYERDVAAKEVVVASAIAADCAGILLNVHRADSSGERRWRGMFGVAAGFAGAVVGVFMAGTGEGFGVQTGGVVSIGLGLASVGMGARQLNPPRPEPRLAWTPSIFSTADGGTGIAIQARF